MSVSGADGKLDILISVLVMGLYPNVCYHKDKRRLITMGGKSALIHKNSVNCQAFDTVFPLPFFVFGEKIRTRSVKGLGR